jgi:ABC-type sugar transport system substrate-binding protein
MDAVAHGVAQALAGAGCGLRLFPADLRGGRAAIAERQEAAMAAALAAGVRAIVLFVLDVNAPVAGTARALARGVPVVAIHKPAYRVSATVVVANYHHGVVLAQALARGVPAGARVAIVGGPEILDDIEMVRGAVHGARDAGLRAVNDPFQSRYRNLTDVRGGGRVAAENLLADFHPFAGFLVFNDETLLDVIEVLEQHGLAGRLPAVSRNGSPEVVALVARGRALATFDYHLPEIGLTAGELALQCLGRDPPSPDALVSASFGDLFTRENAQRYVPWHDRVRHGELVVAA